MPGTGTIARRRLLAAGAAALAGTLPARADTLAAATRRGELVCATTLGVVPFDLREGGAHVGLAHDLAAAVARALGLRARFVDMPATSLLAALEAGQCDVVTAPLAATPERMRRVAFTAPVAEASAALMIRAGDARLLRPQDVAGRRVGGAQGSAPAAAFTAWARGLPRPATLVAYAGVEAASVDLATGRLDAVVGALPELGYAVARRRGRFVLLLPPFGARAYLAWAGRPGPEDAALLAAVDAALARMREDGRMAAIQTRWLGQPVPLPAALPGRPM